jgi:alpha-galactosidase
MEDGSIALGLFNVSGEKHEIGVSLKELGLTGTHEVRDLWRQKNLGSFADSFTTSVNAPGVVLVKIK